MANETTSTSWSNATLSESLRGNVPAHTADKQVVRQLCAEDTIDGEASLSRDYIVESDLGAMSAGSEGTDISANIELALASNVTVTPTEGAAGKADITLRAIKRRLGGPRGNQIRALLQSRSVEQVTTILQQDANRLLKMAREKIEDDCANLLGSLTNTVGTSGTDMGLVDALEAIYQLETQNPSHELFGWVMTPNQRREMMTALAGASGTAAAAWMQQADASFLNQMPDVSRNGLKGTFLGSPWFNYVHDLRTTANAAADVVGAYMCLPHGNKDPLGGQGGPFVIVEGEPMFYDIDYDASGRNMELILIAEYAAAVYNDADGVGIVTDAP